MRTVTTLLSAAVALPSWYVDALARLEDGDRNLRPHLELSQDEARVDAELSKLLTARYLNWTAPQLSVAAAPLPSEGVTPPYSEFFSRAWRHIVADSELYSFVRSFPKGRVPHLHSGSQGRRDWLLTEGLQLKNCAFCAEPTGCADASGFSPPGSKAVYAALSLHRGGDGWVPCEEKHAAILEPLLASTPAFEHMNSTEAWAQFNQVFLRVGPLFQYAESTLAYTADATKVYLSEGYLGADIRMLWTYQQTLRSFETQQPLGLAQTVALFDHAESMARAELQLAPQPTPFWRLIVTLLRVVDVPALDAAVDKLQQELATLPPATRRRLLGFDLVGEEQPNHTTRFYAEVLLRVRDELGLPLYLHAGESLAPFGGAAGDDNVRDAVLLESRRIGHGFGLVNYPKAAEVARERTILEVCPWSNNVLRYVDDLRSHTCQCIAVARAADCRHC